MVRAPIRRKTNRAQIVDSLLAQKLNYDRPVKLAEDIYWVGFVDETRGLCCNPYLIVDGDEGVLIDGGSRPEFSIVAMKILQTALLPNQISTLIYQHYDPDLCGSVANLESLIDRPDLRVVSKRENNVFIRYYGPRSKLLCIDQMDRRLVLKSGRTLRFIHTPYAHAPGAFMTLDEKSGILFTSDLFGGFDADKERRLFRELPAQCLACTTSPLPSPHQPCDTTGGLCGLSAVMEFHRVEMSSNRALRHACKKILTSGARMVAPQHGSIWPRKKDIEHIAARLMTLQYAGIDGVVDAEC